MLFCPHCGNILLVESAAAGAAGASGLRFYCQTCPYIHGVTATHRKVASLVRKQVEDVCVLRKRRKALNPPPLLSSPTSPPPPPPIP